MLEKLGGQIDEVKISYQGRRKKKKRKRMWEYKVWGLPKSFSSATKVSGGAYRPFPQPGLRPASV